MFCHVFLYVTNIKIYIYIFFNCLSPLDLKHHAIIGTDSNLIDSVRLNNKTLLIQAQPAVSSIHAMAEPVWDALFDSILDCIEAGVQNIFQFD